MRFLFAIPNYSTKLSDIKMLNRCVKSLIQHEPVCEQDIWIFDDGSPFFDRDLIAHKRVIRREQNYGYAVTINDAIKFAQNYKYHCLVTINTDIELVKPFINRAETVLNFDPKVAVIGPMLLYPNGRVQSAGFDITPEGSPIEYFKNEMFVNNPEGLTKPRYVMGVTGAFQIIRMKALEKIGVYDQAYNLSYEDVEFCFRTWKTKHRCFYDPHLRAIHAESATRGYHVGRKEFASFQRWVKAFTPGQRRRVMQAVQDANLEAQQQSEMRNRHVQLMLKESQNRSTQSCEAPPQADQSTEPK